MFFESRYRRASEFLVGETMHAFLATRLEGPLTEPSKTTREAGQLFKGGIHRPLLLRQLLLGLQQVVTSRFDWHSYSFVDPVITAAAETLRFEAFSGCAGVYARIDLTPDFFDRGDFGAPGTTNVDLNPSFVRKLVGLRPDRDCALEVGTDSLRLETHRGEAIEKKVPLPPKWIRGFLQVQAAQQRSTPLIELPAPVIRQLVHDLPAQALQPLFIDFRGRRPRLLRRAPAGRIAPGSVLSMPGAHRLKLLQDVLPGLKKVRLFQVAETGVTVWIGDAEGARLTLAISGGLNRGFSGDGDALLNASGTPGEPGEAIDGSLESLRELIEKHQVASIEQLMIDRQAKASEIRSGLDRLAAQGFVGYDRASENYFYRVLPFENADLPVPPRLRGAQKLIEAGAVEVESRRQEKRGTVIEGWVRSSGGEYRCRAIVAAGRLVDGDCTCLWARRHGLERGPCKHLLALRSVAESREGDRHV